MTNALIFGLTGQDGAYLAKFLLEEHPVLIWSFFFGLIIASIYFVGKQIKKWSLSTVIALIAGAAIAFYISNLPSLASNTNSYFLFIAGAIAICAMILPGISGSFILLILGKYFFVTSALKSIIKNLLDRHHGTTTITWMLGTKLKTP